MLLENGFGKYPLYATGEIFLVVIGILIALQINDANDARKERLKEVHYLENITTDLQMNIQEMDRYLATRTPGLERQRSKASHGHRSVDLR